MNTMRIFLASSFELEDDRKEFELFVHRKSKDWEARGVSLQPVLCEDFLDVMSQTRLQDEYNRAVRECDLFVMLFFSKVGKFTEEEFDTAFGQFQATRRPFILTYFKDAEISIGAANKQDLTSLWAFQDKLRALGHYQTIYKNIEGLKLHFGQQLDKLAAGGFIEFKPDEADKSGGADGVFVGGGNSGTINAGTHIDTGGAIYVGGDVNTGGGDFIGHDRVSNKPQVK